MRLIDADALIAYCDKNWIPLNVDAVNDQPTIEPERKTGKWIDGILPNDNGGLPVIVCDQCNTFYPLQFGASHRFCPNCGADMRGEQDDKP